VPRVLQDQLAQQVQPEQQEQSVLLVILAQLVKREQQVLSPDQQVPRVLQVQQAVLVLLGQLVQLATQVQLEQQVQQVQMDSLKLLVQPHQHLLSLAKFGTTQMMVEHIFITTMEHHLNGLNSVMQT
jgi:hypothetical protein